MANPHLRIVEDGHQNVVVFVRRGAEQFAKGGQPLCLGKLLFEQLQLVAFGDFS